MYANGGITSGSLLEGIYPPLLGDEGRPHLGGDEHTAYGVDEMDVSSTRSLYGQRDIRL